MEDLNFIDLVDFNLECGKREQCIALSYQTFGPAIGEAPVVLVNHALTGNSNVCGVNGWWNKMVGPGKAIDTDSFTVLVFNIPGNGFDGKSDNLIFGYKDYNIRDIAGIFWQGLFKLGINRLFAVTGGSLGGAVSWEMGVLHVDRIDNLIPIASDWKATDWLVANVIVQQQILEHSVQPIEDARAHAMLLYRTPLSFKKRFQRRPAEEVYAYQVEDWLDYHGKQLKGRFSLSAYKLMNHLLKTNDITRGRQGFTEIANKIEASIHMIGIDSDCFFTADENIETYNLLKDVHPSICYHEIKSVHGHDGFLIEYDQLGEIIKNIIKTK